MSTYVQLIKGGSVARLSQLQMAARGFNQHRPPSTRRTWREMRHATMKDHRGLSQGFNGSDNTVPVWYSHDGEQFRDETDCHDVNGARIPHTGWFCDEYSSRDNMAIGIVAFLPHGRMIAGYRLTMNDERVYFPGVHLNAVNAARAADEHARVMAEDEREYQSKEQALRDRVERYNECAERVTECVLLRNHPCMKKLRATARTLIMEMREIRDELRGTDYASEVGA